MHANYLPQFRLIDWIWQQHSLVLNQFTLCSRSYNTLFRIEFYRLHQCQNAIRTLWTTVRSRCMISLTCLFTMLSMILLQHIFNYYFVYAAAGPWQVSSKLILTLKRPRFEVFQRFDELIGMHFACWWAPSTARCIKWWKNLQHTFAHCAKQCWKSKLLFDLIENHEERASIQQSSFLRRHTFITSFEWKKVIYFTFLFTKRLRSFCCAWCSLFCGLHTRERNTQFLLSPKKNYLHQSQCQWRVFYLSETDVSWNFFALEYGFKWRKKRNKHSSDTTSSVYIIHSNMHYYILLIYYIKWCHEIECVMKSENDSHKPGTIVMYHYSGRISKHSLLSLCNANK